MVERCREAVKGWLEGIWLGREATGARQDGRLTFWSARGKRQPRKTVLDCD